MTKTGVGTYALAATAPGSLTAALGALAFTPRQNQVAMGQTVTTGFTLTATDDQGATATSRMASVVATSVNSAPTLAKPVLSYTVAEGQTVQNLYRDILANVRDDDVGDVTQITVASIGQAGTSGMAYLDPTCKVLTCTADGFKAKQPTDSFTYTVTDGHGGMATGTVALIVTGASRTTQLGTAGADTLTASKSGQRLIGGEGGDRLTANASDTLVFAGRGDDAVAVNAAKTVVYGAAGTNTITFGANTTQNTVVLQQGGRDELYGFKLTNGSQLDLRQVLAEAQIALTDKSQLGTYFGVTSSGTNAALSFNPNGTASRPGSTLAVLHGVGANTTLSTLVANNALAFG